MQTCTKNNENLFENKKNNFKTLKFQKNKIIVQFKLYSTGRKTYLS